MGCGGSKAADPTVVEPNKKEPENLHPREQPPSRRLVAVYPPVESSKVQKFALTLLKDDNEWRKMTCPKAHRAIGVYMFYPGFGRLEPFATFPQRMPDIPMLSSCTSTIDLVFEALLDSSRTDFDVMKVPLFLNKNVLARGGTGVDILKSTKDGKG